MLPKIGSLVTVTTEHRMATFWADTEYHEITGEVINSPSWLKPTEFAVSNLNHPNGFSVINMTNVVDIRDADGREYKFTTDPSVRVWTVTGSKGDEYTVKCQDGEYSCSCPGFMYRKHCRHITEVK
jgi:hypothetical protein